MGFDARKEADRVLLSRFVSAAILVNSQLQAIQFRGQIGPFIGPLSGAASLNVFRLIDESLRPALRLGMASVRKTNQTYRRQRLTAQLHGGAQTLDFEIIPLGAPASRDTHCLIVFAQSACQGAAAAAVGELTAGREARPAAPLRDDLAAAQESPRGGVVEGDNASDALLVALEELRVTNAELSASNAELERTNDTLTRYHDAVQMRNAELSQLLHDHLAVVAAASVAAALFGLDRCLRRTTPLAASIMRTASADIGRPVSELRTGLSGCDLPDLMSEVITQLEPRKAEALDDLGQHYEISARPYYAIEGTLDGVLLTIVETTALYATRAALADAERRIGMLERALVVVPGPSN